MLLLCSAWKNEIAKFDGKFKGNPIAIQTLGIGYLDAALKLQEIILRYKNSENPINHILFLGTAGAYDPNTGNQSSDKSEGLKQSIKPLDIKDIVIIDSVSLIHQGELGGSTYVPENLAKEIYHPHSHGNLNPSPDDFENKLLDSLSKDSELLTKTHCFSSLEITRDERIYDKITNNHVNENLKDKAIVENMELFGIAKVADQYQVPWSSFLTISNKIHADAHQEWLTNHQECSDKLCDFVIKVIYNHIV